MDSSGIIISIISACSALGGVCIGQWLGRKERDIQFKRESLFQVNKFVLIWVDSLLAKLPFELGITEEYLREVSDRVLEGKAQLEVIGSISLNLAFDDLRNIVKVITQKALKCKADGKLNPNEDIRQFGESEYKAYLVAKRDWINMLRKEVGAEAVKVIDSQRKTG